MESFKTLAENSQDYNKQLMTNKRPMPSSTTDAFAAMSSKKDLFDHLSLNLQVSISNFISNIMQYYTPSYEMFTKDFAKEVFSGRKKLLKLKDVKFIQVKKYEELSVKNLYDRFLGLSGMKDYFPEKYAKHRQCDREYMFNVANTLHEDEVQELIQHAQI